MGNLQYKKIRIKLKKRDALFDVIKKYLKAAAVKLLGSVALN
jgi:hypothetical protein